MNDTTRIATILFAGLVVLAGAIAAQPGSGPGPGRGGPGTTPGGGCGVCPGTLFSYLETIAPAPLEPGEVAGLVLMREEEKLARDVYRALAESWGGQVFYNIAAAEQRHMNAVGALIERYGLADPVAEDTPGVFSDPQLQGLFHELVGRAKVSWSEALYAGATIEDLDLNDLDRLLAETDNADVAVVYQNLAKGSRNHLRAFVGLLEAQGQSYGAQYLDADIVEEILATSRERGVLYDENGETLATFPGCTGSGPGGGPRHGGRPRG